MTALGVITGNDPAGFTRFGAWLGRKPDLALLAFNQDSVEAFRSSIPWIVQQGVAFMQAGAEILWSVPCPGPGQLEVIAAGGHDAAYMDIAARILAATPGDNVIRVRPPWEMNLALNKANAGKDSRGRWSGQVFIAAWSRIASIFRQASRRFRLIWCPNVGVTDYDPIHFLPHVWLYDVIAQDFYLQKACDHPNIFSWFRDEARGLGWGAQLARDKGKLYGLSEWGMDDDRFVPDFAQAVAWLEPLKPMLDHACWWDRPEGIDCRLDTGRPKLAAAYKAAFA